jgi:hypothetical protein
VATTAVEIARRHRAQVIAADISPLMLERAEPAPAAGVASIFVPHFAGKDSDGNCSSRCWARAPGRPSSPRQSPSSPTGPRRRPSWPGSPGPAGGAGDRVLLAHAADR